MFFKIVGGMSFRDIQKFNNDLLAKQVWRYFHNKETLLYIGSSVPNIFLQEIFYDAPVHLKCSFAWRSILQSRDAIN